MEKVRAGECTMDLLGIQKAFDALGLSEEQEG